jgi:hypothetical protein
MTAIGLGARAALAILLLAPVASVAACSDADGGGQRDAYVDRLAEALDAPTLDADGRECFAESLVDTIGIDALSEHVALDDIGPDFAPAEYGIEIDERQGDEFYERLTGCVDVRALFLESLSAGQDLPRDTLDCLDRALDDDLVERIVVATFTQGDAAANDPELAEAMNAISTQCAPTRSGSDGA